MEVSTMKLSVIGIAVMLAAAPIAAQPAAGGTTITGQDRELDSRIAKRIADDPTLKKDAIKVTVEGGVVTLSGMVSTEADKMKAERLATIPGVTRVDNKLTTHEGTKAKVKGTAGKVTDKSKDAGEKVVDKSKDVGGKVVDKSKDVGGKVVDKTKEGASKTGEVVTDGWISTRIKTKFMGEEALRASDIKVDTNDHVVTLSGTVVSAAAHAKAVEMAKGVEGVSRIIDKLVVTPKP
jgi:osmotically-inducible protein OsmY